jgi:glycosyltransferase involved in cell wall biosynthesis
MIGAKPNLLLLLMVRNEAKIIQRCLEAATPHVDAVILADTGSEDDTINIVKKNCELPLKVVEHIWLDFGLNRTISFEAAVEYAKDLEWDLTNSWVICQDADMILCNTNLREHIQYSA